MCVAEAHIVAWLHVLQEHALQGNLISTCLEQLSDPHDQLRQWLALCLAKVHAYRWLLLLVVIAAVWLSLIIAPVDNLCGYCNVSL